MKKTLFVVGMILLIASGQALAKDAIKATVSANGFTFTESGNPVSPGTYAVGTLKIFMIVSATQWPATLSPIELDLAVDPGKPTPATKYAVPIRLRQAGGDLVLTPSPAQFSVAGISWTDFSTIGITVPQAIRDDPTFNEDGVELIANLQIEPTMPGMHLDTVTTVKIYAKLVHPTSCLRAVSFISDNGLTTNLSETDNGLTINYKISNNQGFSFQGISPPQTIFNTLVVNSCSQSKTFDLTLFVDSHFSVPTLGQPVKRYISANAAPTEEGLIDTFAELQTAVFDPAVPLGQNLCVSTITLNGMYSLWVKADVGLNTSGFTALANLPAVGTEYNGFTADVLTSNGTCSGGSHPESEGQATASVKIKARYCSGNACPPTP